MLKMLIAIAYNVEALAFLTVINFLRSDVQVYGTFTSHVYELVEWLKSFKVKRIALESTGIYWGPIWNILEEQGMDITLVNP